MTDKEQNKKSTSTSETNKDNKPEVSPVESKPTLSAAEATKIAAQAKLAKTKEASSKSPHVNKVSKKSDTASNKNGISKVAILALLIAIGAGAGAGWHYFLQQQKNNLLEQQIAQASTDGIKKLEAKIATEINQAKQQYKTQLAQMTTQLNQKNEQLNQQRQNEINQLQQALGELISTKPNNANITEAEYLVRMAGRVLWLEQNVNTALALMQDADSRLSEVKDPRLLPIRQLIHQDMEQLKLLPQLKTEEIILSFMGLSKQVGQLPLASLQLPEATDKPVDTELSENIDDWRDNLAKSWHSFKEEFITVRRRTGQVEALMEPQFQRNLYHNIDLKIQQIQWAASQKNSSLYLKSISELQLWLADYFDMNVPFSEQFNRRLDELKTMPVNVHYPNSLASQHALQILLEPTSTTQALPENSQSKIVVPNKIPAEPVKGSEENIL